MDSWLDFLVMDTGAPSYALQGYERTLEKGERGKVEKHSTRVEVAEGGHFLPIVVSVYGTLAPGSHKFLYRCTERMMGPEGSQAKGFSRQLHLQRARMQAAIANAVNLCLWGRGKKAEKDEKAARLLKEETAKDRLPERCVLADAVGWDC